MDVFTNTEYKKYAQVNKKNYKLLKQKLIIKAKLIRISVWACVFIPVTLLMEEEFTYFRHQPHNSPLML